MTSDRSLSEQAYQRIQQNLLDGSLRAGQILSEQALADELGISRTPVREAIGLLEMEGLIERIPRVGTIVRSPDYRDLRELYEVREALESAAAAAACSRLSTSDRDLLARSRDEIARVAVEMREHELDYLDGSILRRYLDADIAFHMIIVRGLNNRRCIKIISEFRVIQRIFEYHRVIHTVRLVEQARDQHTLILEAIHADDAQTARQAMITHILCCREHALRAFGRSAPEEAAPDLPVSDPMTDFVEHLLQAPGI